jgi:hypothetical protein
LAGLAHDARRLDREIGEAVAEARAAGASWADVARPLRVSRQAAQQRFAPRAYGAQEAEALGSTAARLGLENASAPASS